MVDKRDAGKLLTEDQFYRAAAETRMSETSRDAAWHVLVKGEMARQVAQMAGFSEPRLSKIVNTIRGIAKKQLEQAKSQTAEVEADFAFAVRAVRRIGGDASEIVRPAPDGVFIGNVVDRSEFHLVQDLGRGRYVVHDLSKVDRVPSIGSRASIHYDGGRGTVSAINTGRSVERGR